VRNDDLLTGVHNLLVTCGGMKRGETLFVLHEGAEDRYYDSAIVEAVRQGADLLGIKTVIKEAPFSPEVSDPHPDMVHEMNAADRTLFLARMGDQIRFRESMARIRPIVSYALDAEMLGSSFGRADYRAFVALKDAVNTCLYNAKEIKVTCPLGTDFTGVQTDDPAVVADVTVTRFPMSVFTPVPAQNFTGRIAQKGFLVGTGSQYYDPYACALEGVLTIHFDGNQITGFDGLPEDIETAKNHYEHVGEKYDIDRHFVHSWHVGIHPGCNFTQPVSACFKRWSGGAFGNPRLLHFHTCGAYAPGEISLNVLDPTVCIDGINLWENGRFYPERMPGGKKVLEAFPDVREVFDNPAQGCGQGADGQLSYT